MLERRKGSAKESRIWSAVLRHISIWNQGIYRPLACGYRTAFRYKVFPWLRLQGGSLIFFLIFFDQFWRQKIVLAGKSCFSRLERLFRCFFEAFRACMWAPWLLSDILTTVMNGPASRIKCLAELPVFPIRLSCHARFFPYANRVFLISCQLAG